MSRPAAAPAAAAAAAAAPAPVSAAAAALPRDLDVSPLRPHVLTHTPPALGTPLRYFPLSVLVHVTEAAGSTAPKRQELVRATGDMLRFRVTPQQGQPAQLSCTLEELLKPRASEWIPPLVAGAHPPQPPDAEYVSHRGFLEAIAFWMNSRGLIMPDGRPAPIMDGDPFMRLKKFYAHKDVIGELLFGVAAPPSQLPPPLTHTAIAPDARAGKNTEAAGLPSAAFLTPPEPAGPVTASLPPQGMPTIQEEIESAEAATPVKREAAGASSPAAGSSAMVTDDAAAATSSNSSPPAAAASASSFLIPAEGILVHATRFDGRNLFALSGKLVGLLPLTLTSPMPAERNPAQTLSVRQQITGDECTIEQYWAERGFAYGDPSLKDADSPRRIRICQVKLDEGLPYIFPADKVWRQVGPGGPTAQAPSAEPLAALGADDVPVAPATAVSPYSATAQLWLSVAASPFDLPSWQRLLTAAHATHDLLTIRHAYAGFLKVFPTSATHWKQLVEVELAHNEFAEVERIFKQVLLRIPEIELWKLYLVYIKLSHAPPMAPSDPGYEAALQSQSVAIETAYEFVLKHVGLDLHSGQVWKSYVNFMRAIPARSADEESAKTSSLRKIFHRALCVPLQPKELELLWSDYEAFEKGVAAGFANKTLSAKLLAEYATKFQQTSSVSRERRRKFQGILSASVGMAYGQKHAVTAANVHVANRPSSNSLQQTLDAIQLQHWIRYLRFEQFQTSHMLKQDVSTFRQRVLLAYRQCLLYMRHYPNIWSDLLKFHYDTHSSAEEIRAVWREFAEAMPYSILPTLIKAEWEEEAKRIVEAKAAYDSLLLCKGKDEPPAEEHSFTIPQAVVDEIKAVRERKGGADAQGGTPATKKEEDAASTGASAAIKEEEEEAGDNKDVSDQGVVDIYKGLLHQLHPLVFILMMRFLRRCEGVDASRKVFLSCRRHPSVTYHSFLYAAYAEHHIHMDLPKAQAIYSVGMKLFGETNDAYLRRYLAFLHETNDHQNLRLHFGRLLLTESADALEAQAHLSKTERAQMRKAQQAATAAKEGAAAAAAAAAAASSHVHPEAEDDPAISPDDWWAHINSLLPSSAPAASSSSHARGSSWRDRLQDRDGSGLSTSARSSSLPLPSPTLLSLWSSYVSFERDTAGDLAVLLKAEQKRDEKLSLRYSHRIVAWLDRWRFLDLWPCSRALRQTLDLMIRPDGAQLAEKLRREVAEEAERMSMAQGMPASAAASAAAEASAFAMRQRGVLTSDPQVISALKGGMARPDVSRLSAFSAHGGLLEQERAAALVRYGPVAPPTQILNVLSVLPPGHLFTGPFVHPQLIMDMLQMVEDTPSTGAGAAGGEPGPTQTTAGTGAGAGAGGRPQGSAPAGKGKRKQQSQEDDEEEAAAAAMTEAPTNDLYRQRQQQKMAKLHE